MQFGSGEAAYHVILELYDRVSQHWTEKLQTILPLHGIHLYVLRIVPCFNPILEQQP